MNFIKYLTILVLGVSLVACDDYLEDPQPAQSLPSASAFERVQDLETALVGAYSALQQGDFHTNNEMVANIMSDNGTWQGSFPSYIEVFNRQMNVDNGESAESWREGYLAINHANLVLSSIDMITDPELTAAVSARLRGEALFIRGMVHFELVRFFAQPYGPNSGSDLGIPVITESVSGTADIIFPTRNTVEEVYNQAIADLTEAANLLPADFTEYGKANRWAALGYLAEIAFQQRNYAEAARLSGEVLGGPFTLAAAASDPFFNEGTSGEVMFAIANTVQDNPGVNGSLPTFHHVNGRGGDVIVSDDLKASGYDRIITAGQQTALDGAGLTATDERVSVLTSVNETNPDVLNIEKYEDFTNNSDDAIFLRTAAFMLIRAEALARNESAVSTEALDLLNQVRGRAIVVTDASGAVVADDPVLYTAGDFANVDEFIEAIILERRVELAFEGDRLHDLKRLQRDVRGLPFDDGMLIWPIPQRDIDANGNLIQNPAYQ